MTSSSTTGRLNSEGRSKLAAVGLSAAEIGRAVGADRRTVASWLAARKRPGSASRRKLHERFGIDVNAWSSRPGASKPAEPSVSDLRPTTIEECEAILADVQQARQRKDLAPIEVARLATCAANLLEKITKMESIEAQRFEAVRAELRVVSRPFIEAIGAALKPFPEALDAVADALDKLDLTEAMLR